MSFGPPIDVLPLFAREEQALIDLLGGLSVSQWTLPTVCTGWTVHDLAAHILGVKLGRLSHERDDHHSLTPRPDEPFPRFIDRINDEWVVACRRLSPEVLFAMLVDSTSQLSDLWARADLDELGPSVWWAGPSPAPRWLDVAREYTELWVHQQQIRDALGAPGLNSAEFRGPVVDTFMRALPFTLRDISPRVGRQVTYTVTGAGGGRWTARYSASGWSVDRGAATTRAPLASAATDADTFWRLCTRTPAAGSATFTGDENVCAALASMVSIII